MITSIIFYGTAGMLIVGLCGGIALSICEWMLDLREESDE